jgi:hypothetical protein
MPSGSGWGTPRESIRRECARRGADQVVAGCATLLSGQDADDDLVVALGGPHGRAVLDTGPAPAHHYWLRVWGARGLLQAWDLASAAGQQAAVPALLAGLADEAWRVREMSAKVVARHQVDPALAAVAELQHDRVPRVRAAAGRALAALTSGG